MHLSSLMSIQSAHCGNVAGGAHQAEGLAAGPEPALMLEAAGRKELMRRVEVMGKRLTAVVMGR